MHFECGDVNQKAGPDELVVLVMIAQHVTDILAKEALDAFAEFLNAINVRLRHSPRAIRRIRRAWFEFLDPLLHPEIPRHICRQIALDWESFDRLNRDRLCRVDVAQPRHTHQPWDAVNLGRTRSALPRFAIPAAGKVVSLS